jgi:hypothetical protein
MVTADEVAPGVAHRGEAEASKRIQNVRATSQVVRKRARRSVHAIVDGAAHVLKKSAKDSWVNGIDSKRSVEMKGSGVHWQ